MPPADILRKIRVGTARRCAAAVLCGLAAALLAQPGPALAQKVRITNLSDVDFGTITNLVGDPRLPANASINSIRNRYDQFGNLVETIDPLHVSRATGHAREYGYDPVFHTYVERETIHVGNGSPALVASAGYDYGAGVMTSATNFNGHATTFQYDSFWRLSVKHGAAEKLVP